MSTLTKQPVVNRKYGVRWPESMSPLDIEFWMIQKGHKWLKKRGSSLFFHFRAAQKLIWPQDDHHRWSDAILQTFCENDISVFIGCSDSCKTWSMSKIVLIDYWAHPHHTLWLVSTTEGRGSELRIYGNIKDLFNLGRARYPHLPGHPIDYLKTITSDTLDDEGRDARSLRRGIIVVPCKVGGIASGLAPYIGIKAPRLRHAGDEVQLMSQAFLDAYSNWYGKEDFKGMMAGNFLELDDPLGTASEPVDGWDTFVDTGKTQSWRSKFFDAQVLALDGRDTPNNDYPLTAEGVPRFTYLIGPKKLDAVSTTHGKDSWQWWSQCVGKPAKGLDIWRVFSKDFCRTHKAMDDIMWRDGRLLSLYALDPAYGGGDRCIGRKLELGYDVHGQQILFVHGPELIPVSAKTDDQEAQIARFIKRRLEELGIQAQNCFYDSFGRGTLGFEFSKLFGSSCPVPVDSSAQASKRPVRHDLWVDEVNGTKRLKRCDEHYTKFVTELWFSFREAIDATQVRGLDWETLRELCWRKFTKNKWGRIEVEPKEEMKERMSGKSPDLADCVCIGCEGARQRGFKIKQLGSALVQKEKKPDWLDQEVEKQKRLLASKQLVTR